MPAPQLGLIVGESRLEPLAPGSLLGCRSHLRLAFAFEFCLRRCLGALRVLEGLGLRRSGATILGRLAESSEAFRFFPLLATLLRSRLVLRGLSKRSLGAFLPRTMILVAPEPFLAPDAVVTTQRAIAVDALADGVKAARTLRRGRHAVFLVRGCSQGSDLGCNVYYRRCVHWGP
jgi:hypothetical protein